MDQIYNIITSPAMHDFLFGDGTVQVAFWGALAKLAAPIVGGMFGGGAQNRDAELKARSERDRLQLDREKQFQDALIAREENRRRNLTQGWKGSRAAEYYGRGGRGASPFAALLSEAARQRMAPSLTPSAFDLDAAEALRRTSRPMLEPGDQLESQYGRVGRAPITDEARFEKLLKPEPWWKRLLGVGAGLAPQIAGSFGGGGGGGRLGTTQMGDD